MHDSIQQLLARADAARMAKQPEDAKRALLEAASAARAQEYAPDLAAALCALGQIERDLKDLGAALKHYREAEKLYRGLGEDLGVAHALRHIGDVLRERSAPKHDDALACYKEALAIYRNCEPERRLDLANTLRGLALLKQSTGEMADATSHWIEARDLYASVGVNAGVEESARRLAALKAERE